MKNIDNIVLNIPHSSINNFNSKEWDNSKKIIEYFNQMTDWFTDKLFYPNPIFKNINPIIADYSRFYIDCERLENDPLEKIGQGIIYTKYNDVNRIISNEKIESLKLIYYEYINKLKSMINDKTLLIDCHSFSNSLSNIDICIGFNNDWSRPNDKIIETIMDVFNGFKIAINEPYSNSISPILSFNYQSVMIEVNKKLYMNEKTICLNSDSYKLHNLINKIYELILEN